MSAAVSVHQRATVRGRISPATIRRRARRLLDALGMPGAELSIVLTDDDEIRALNREWRRQDKPTDVLSFPLLEGEVPAGTDGALGDVVISLDTARRQVEEGCLPRLRPLLGDAACDRWTLLDEVTFLLLHGVLHLVGHDHETPPERERMEALEAELLPRLLGRRR